ncbi:MAG: hypothetical protein U0807_13835 [Candidatus Binatia bacterium]
MTVDDADALVAFPDVRIIRSMPQSLLCGIGDRQVWLPRRHVSGKFLCAGDRGTLRIRRWVARDRRLVDPDRSDPVVSGTLRLVRGEGNPQGH